MGNNRIRLKRRFHHRRSFKYYAAWLIGLLSAQNIVYIFSIGNTNVNIIYVAAFAYLLVCTIKQNARITVVLDQDLSIYLAAIVLSVIPYLYYRAFSNLSLSWTGYFASLVILFANIVLFNVVVSLKNYIKQMIGGLLVGVCLNLFIALLQLIWFYRGTPFLFFRNIFPNISFMIAVPYANRALTATSDYVIYQYRATGAFIETSYLFAFMSSFFILSIQNTTLFKKTLLFIVVLAFALLSSTGNIITCLVAWGSYLLFGKIMEKRSGNKQSVINRGFHRHAMIRGIRIGALAILVLILFIAFRKYGSSIGMSSEDLLLQNKSFSFRFESILNALQLIPKYIFGVGYGMSPSLMNAEYAGTRNASFSYLIQIVLETGLLGMLGYFYFIWRTISKLVKKGRTRYQAAVLSGFIGAVLAQIFSGIGFLQLPAIWVIFALCYMEKTSMHMKGRPPGQG